MIEGSPYEDMEIEDIVMKAGGAVFNNAAQAWNHNFYFQTLTPAPVGIPEILEDRLTKAFGTVARLKAAFIKAASTLFGSGWAWLCQGQGRQPHHSPDAERRQPDDPGAEASPYHRCVGACILYRLQEPQGGLPGSRLRPL